MLDPAVTQPLQDRRLRRLALVPQRIIYRGPFPSSLLKLLPAEVRLVNDYSG